MVPLKYLSNFWRTLEMTLINCEVNLILTCETNCIITNLTGAGIFEIKDTKLNLSKQQILDADPKANHQIDFKADLNRGDDNTYTRIYFIFEEAK